MAREEARLEWLALAHPYGAHFGVIECIGSDETIHHSCIEGRNRDIPGWYEITLERVSSGRDMYVPLNEPKLQLDSTSSVESSIGTARGWMASIT